MKNVYVGLKSNENVFFENIVVFSYFTSLDDCNESKLYQHKGNCLFDHIT